MAPIWPKMTSRLSKQGLSGPQDGLMMAQHRPWYYLGAISGPVWGHLGVIFGYFGVDMHSKSKHVFLGFLMISRYWVMLGRFLLNLGPPWTILWPCWAILGPFGPHTDWQNLLSVGVDIEAGRAWGYPAPSWGHLECQKGLP